MINFPWIVKSFLREDEGQASGEYVILIGGIIVAAILIYVAYYGIVKSSGQSINTSAANATEKMGGLIENASGSIG